MLEAIGSPKILTVSVAALCIVLFLARVSQPNLGGVCLQPESVVTRLQIYRVVTAPFFHGGFFHILFNMIAWMIIGRDYEKTSGTFPALYTIFVLLIPLIATLHVAAAYLIDALAGTSARSECAVGISGLLFALLVVNVELSAAPSVSVFGFFSMPARWYPLALAGVLQLLSPGLSLMGHLSGIVLGYLLVFGYLQAITPPDYRLEDIEQRIGLTSIPLWQPIMTGIGVYDPGRLPQTNEPSGSSAWGRVTSWFSRSTPPSNSSQPFAGQGRTLGGQVEPIPAGRVPPTSRILVEAEKAQKAAAAAATTGPSRSSASEPERTVEEIVTEAEVAVEGTVAEGAVAEGVAR